MAISREFGNFMMFRIFLSLVGLTFAVWILRGFQVLGFIPGGVLWVGVLVSIATGILTAWENSKRW
ncbi:hypothetical protein CKA32_005667 [Geitlerinema sp. FC II]|nr:hypothetical protein CKA32_005667 [Geitlerinema sp. FC II]